MLTARPTPAPMPARRSVSSRMAGREDQTEGKGWEGSALASRMPLNTSNRVMAAARREGKPERRCWVPYDAYDYITMCTLSMPAPLSSRHVARPLDTAKAFPPHPRHHSAGTPPPSVSPAAQGRQLQVGRQRQQQHASSHGVGAARGRTPCWAPHKAAADGFDLPSSRVQVSGRAPPQQDPTVTHSI